MAGTRRKISKMGEQIYLSHRDVSAWTGSVLVTAQGREDPSGRCQLPGQSGCLVPPKATLQGEWHPLGSQHCHAGTQ